MPPTIAALLAGWDRVQVPTGHSGATVYRLAREGAPDRFLKLAPRTQAGELAAERDRLAWIGDQLPVPRVLAFATDAEREYLLTTAVPGLDATEPAHTADLPGLVRILADGLRRLHALPVADCPFDHRLDRQLAAAETRLHAGLVDETDFDAVRQGRPAADLLAELLRTRPAAEDLAFTHGDYCLPNVILEGGTLSGFVDLGRAGIADRYQDLALAARSLPRNCGPGWEALLFQEYGLPHPDPAKIEYYQLLDEFF